MVNFDTLALLGMVLAWFALIAVLGRAAFRAFKKRKTTEAVLLSVIVSVIVMLTGGWIVFFVIALGCNVGLPLGCMK